jgi:hypothetical protein
MNITKKSFGSARLPRRVWPPSVEVAALSRINASLFFELARVVSWGTRHRRVVEAHPDLGRLLEFSAAALRKGGVMVMETPVERLAA